MTDIITGSRATHSLRSRLAGIAREPLLGPFIALTVAFIVFSVVSDTFLHPQNLSLILQQSVVIGLLAVGQTLIILTAGIALSIAAGGRHVYAVGGSVSASHLSGIKSGRVTFSVYALTGLIAAFGAWAALGRIPNADPNALQNANLESITAVVIGGTSLFGGRGGVAGTLIGTLIVGVLR